MKKKCGFIGIFLSQIMLWNVNWSFFYRYVLNSFSFKIYFTKIPCACFHVILTSFLYHSNSFFFSLTILTPVRYNILLACLIGYWPTFLPLMWVSGMIWETLCVWASVVTRSVRKVCDSAEGELRDAIGSAQCQEMIERDRPGRLTSLIMAQNILFSSAER